MQACSEACPTLSHAYAMNHVGNTAHAATTNSERLTLTKTFVSKTTSTFVHICYWTQVASAQQSAARQAAWSMLYIALLIETNHRRLAALSCKYQEAAHSARSVRHSLTHLLNRLLVHSCTHSILSHSLLVSFTGSFTHLCWCFSGILIPRALHTLVSSKLPNWPKPYRGSTMMAATRPPNSSPKT